MMQHSTHGDDLSALDVSAIALHELHQSLLTAGFSRGEAIVLAALIMTLKQDALDLVRRLLDEPREPPAPGADS